MSNKTFYEIWVQAPDIAFSVFVNGIGLHTDRFQGSSEWRQSVNQWVVKGENNCAIKFYAGPNQEALGPDTSCKVEVRELVSGQSEKRLIISREWKYEEGMQWPQSIEFTFPLFPPFSADWEWTHADVLHEENFKDPGLKPMVGKLHEALATKDYPSLKSFLATKAGELALAYQIPLEKRLQDQEEFFSDFFKDPHWGMQPIDWDKVIYDVHAQGRVLEIMSEAGKPLLASTELSGDSNFLLSLYLFRSQGVWKLAR